MNRCKSERIGLKEGADVTIHMRTEHLASEGKVMFVILCTGNGIKKSQGTLHCRRCRLAGENVSSERIVDSQLH